VIEAPGAIFRHKGVFIMSDQVAADILGLTAQIVSAHLSKNRVETGALASLIQSVYRSLSTAGEAEVAPAPAQTPAVPIKKSVFPDYIVCLEDGKKLKMLKRHLQTSYGLSPDAYRAKWGLPRDYPMVAPNYAATRSGLAKMAGLGRKPARTSVPAPEPEIRKLPTRRARGAKN
jgi:predicted transcriptional regulator